jgi:ABC-type branched-subunit amino acid transport system ATPase component
MNAMVVIGGEGSMVGSILGAVVLTVFPELLRFAEQYRMIFYALAMIIAILVFPYGLVGKPKPPREKDDEKKGQKPAGSFGVVHSAKPAAAVNKLSVDPVSPVDENRKPILQVDNLTMAFGGLKAVNNVDLLVQSNSIHSIIGPNGAGKTTFFNVITGFYRPQSGYIRFNGKELAGLKPNEICRLGMARTFQRIRLFRTMTALDNVLVSCDSLISYNTWDSVLRTKRLKHDEELIRERAYELLEFVGLTSKANQFASNLPYGEQRRLEIARALATDVKLLILDEPTAGMSPEETSEVINLIHQLRDVKKLTILLIEHDMKVVMEISDMVSVLDHGIKIAEDIPQEIQKNEQVIEAYLGKEPMVLL